MTTPTPCPRCGGEEDPGGAAHAHYTGRVTANGVAVVTRPEGDHLDPGPSLALEGDHPPNEPFAWGHDDGFRPVQLALALLLDAGCPDSVALALRCQYWAAEVIRWPWPKKEADRKTAVWSVRRCELVEWWKAAEAKAGDRGG